MPRRGENIYKRKDGRWEGRFIKKYDKQGKAKYVSVYAHSYKDVKIKLEQTKHEMSKHDTRHSLDDKYLSDYAMDWLVKMQSQVKHSTYVKYTNIANNHIVPTLGNKKVEELSTDMLRNFVNAKLSFGNIQNHKGLSSKTVKDIVSVLRLILKYTEEIGISSDCNFDLLNIKSKSNPRITINESAHIILTNYLMEETDNIKLGILLCLYTGVRIGEICAMRFEDISLTENIIYVNKTMQRLQTLSTNTGKKTEIIISNPKSESSCREIPLPKFIVDIVVRFAKNPKAYILTGETSKYIEPRTMENKFKACLKKCGLPNYNFHQLRHRFATYCIEVGFEIKTLSEILGHSSVNITLNKYVHSTLELKRANMDKLQNSFPY